MTVVEPAVEAGQRFALAWLHDRRGTPLLMSSRRDFLKWSALATPSLAALSCAGQAGVRGTATTPQGAPLSWKEIRDLFPLRRDRVHMASLLLASHPRPVAQAIDALRRALDEDPVGAWHDQRFEADIEGAVRQSAADYLGGRADDIALTDSTTMGLGLLYGSLQLAEGDEILTTTHDHYSTVRAVAMASQRTGATIRLQ